MKKESQSPSVFLKRIWSSVLPQDKFAFFCGAAVCLIVNMFVYTNTLFVHDSVRLYNPLNYIYNGRILMGLLLNITNRFQLPWVIGLISCILVGLIVVFFARIYQLKSKLNVFLLAGIIVTCDTVVVSHTYFFSLHLYLLSLLLATMAVYYADKKKIGYVLSVALLCASILTYQAFLAAAIGLFVFKLIVFALDKNNSLKQNLLLILKYASITVVAAILYYIIWKLVLKFSGEQIVDYYAYKNLTGGFSVGSLLNSVWLAFSITVSQMFNTLSDVKYALAYVATALYVIAFIWLFIKKKSRSAQVLTAIYVPVYILSVNTMYIISGAVTYSLTTFTLVLPLIMLLYLIETADFSEKAKLKTGAVWAVTVMLAVLIAGQGVYANILYLKVKVNYDNAWSYATRVVDRLEQTEGFTKDSELVIIGSGEYLPAYKQNGDIQAATLYSSKTNQGKACIASNNGITYAQTLEWFIQQEMDMDISITTNPEELFKSDEVKEMGIFPAEDSIRMIDGKIVVKIQETKD